MTAPGRPFLFLDVDGPLLPFGTGTPAREPLTNSGNPLLTRLDPTVGARLLALACDLVWATTWQHEANDTIAPRLGLPRLPMVSWPEDDDAPAPRGLHWKTRRLTEWAGRRPFVWLDDEIGAPDRNWVEAAHPAPALLHRVDPAKGLTEADFEVVREWLGLRSA
ncbi:HAD domain-containing protein [Streptomyces marokkonensis]|uniref:HAD domain-containing protein n=1 Tax=Streptomyces marokkonensis TaxID=324855 RepID=UPI0011F1D396|nr:HAD domain-containing protein [Streptomyces marokkonensis]